MATQQLIFLIFIEDHITSFFIPRKMETVISSLIQAISQSNSFFLQMLKLFVHTLRREQVLYWRLQLAFPDRSQDSYAVFMSLIYLTEITHIAYYYLIASPILFLALLHNVRNMFFRQIFKIFYITTQATYFSNITEISRYCSYKETE